MGLFYDMNYTS